MERKELKKGMTVCHRKYGRFYKIVSCNARLKDSDPEKDWLDCVIYAPLYPNQHEMFSREVNSFVSGFDPVKPWQAFKVKVAYLFKKLIKG